MIKKLLLTILAVTVVFGATACSKDADKENTNIESENAKTDTFSVAYEVQGTTSSGKPKNDTFIFEGTTTDGIVTELNFDIIRNKGTENEYSKKDIMGYLMNISDGAVEKAGEGFNLTKLTAYGFDNEYATGSDAQFMVSATFDGITETTTFKELNFANDATAEDDTVALDKAIIAFRSLAKEAGVEELTGDTLVKDILTAHDLYKDGSFVEGSKRVSFDGAMGGRSYGEQIDAIAKYILDNKMTLEDVYNMFKTVNQPSTSVAERDVISGATIAFVGDFQRMAYLALHGELFEGVTNHSVEDGVTKVETVTQGYAGEIETHITFDAEGKITSVVVRDANETPDIGGQLTKENSDFTNEIIEKQGTADVVSGATKTSDALNKAVEAAKEFYEGL